MSDENEIAKAVQAVANFGEKSLSLADKAGSFLAKVFKEPVDIISDMVSDKLRFVRWKRLLEISDEVNKILEERQISETRAVPPKLALPIFEESTLEEDPTLQSLWNHLLANAMDPNFNNEIRYGFIDMIKSITGTESAILYSFYNSLKRDNRLTALSTVYRWILSKEQIMSMLKLDIDTYSLSINNLMRLQLIAPAILKSDGAKLGSEPLTIYKGIDAVTLTPLGVRFIEACLK